MVKNKRKRGKNSSSQYQTPSQSSRHQDFTSDTPKHASKQLKPDLNFSETESSEEEMAMNMSGTTTNKSTPDSDTVTNMFQELKKGQETLMKTIDDKFNNLETNISNLKSELSSEILKLQKRIEAVESEYVTKKNFDPERTLVIINLPFQTSEDIGSKVQDLLSYIKSSPPPGGDDVLKSAEIVHTLRLQQRSGKPPVVKVEPRRKLPS